MTSLEIALTFSLRNTRDIPSRSNSKRNKQYRLTVNWQASIYFPMPHQSGAPFASVRSFPKEQWYRAGVFFSPLPLPSFLLSLSHLPQGLLFLLSPIFHCHKIKDGGYNNITNTNRVSPTQNTPAMQARLIQLYDCLFIEPRISWWSEKQTILTCTSQWPVCNSAKLNLYQFPLCHVASQLDEVTLSSNVFPFCTIQNNCGNFFNLDSRFAKSGRRLEPVYMEVGVPR